MSRYATTLQESVGFAAFPARRPRRDRRVDLVGSLPALSHAQLAEFAQRLPDNPAQRLPLVVVLAGDGDPAVLARARVHAVRRHLRMGVAQLGGHLAVERVVEHRWCQERHRRLSLGEVDVLALAGAVSMVQRSQDRRAQESRRHVVCVGAEHAGGVAVGPAGHLIEARHRCTHGAETGERRQRPELPEEAARRHDDVGIHLAQVVV